MGLRVFVTGVSGYLGSMLADHLANIPGIDSITGVYNSTTPAQPLSPKLHFVKIDVRSPDLAQAMAGHEIVIHSAFLVLWPARMPAQVRDSINFNGTQNVANAAVQNRVQRFIHASSVAAYDPDLARGKDRVGEDFPIGKGVSPLYYWNSKAKTERLLTELLGPSGMNLTFFRPGYIIGSRDRVTIKNFRENAVAFIGRDPRSQFVHEDDVAAGFMQAVSADTPGAYNLVPDDSIRLSELTRLLSVKFTPTVPVWLARFVAYIRWRYFGSSAHPSWVEAALIDCTASNEKLKGTGWTPRYNCADAIRAAL